MPVEKYEITLLRDGHDQLTDVARAASYLAYGDQTDTVGYLGHVQDVDLLDDHVELIISARMLEPDQDSFERELDTLSDVVEWRRA